MGTPVPQSAAPWSPAARQSAATGPPAGRRRDRWRAAARTAPGRLRLAATGLTLLVLGLGALTGWQVTDRSQAADQVVTHSQPLSQNAAEIYRSLADADTTAAAGFLQAGNEPAATRQRYEDDLANATSLLTQAAARSDGSAQAQNLISRLNQQLPVYAGLVDTARADDRQGLPLGAAYLRYASDTMQTQLLPQAQQLYQVELARLDRDYSDARATPWAAYALGVIALAVLVRFQWTLFKRTNRVFNSGLLAATGALVLMLAWLAGGTLLADSGLQRSIDQGAAPLRALDQARTDTLQARTAENLNLVARGSTTQYADQWTTAAKGDSDALDQAARLAPSGARSQLATARARFTDWTKGHDTADQKNNAGDYQGALDATVGSGPGSDAAAFDAVDQSLAKAVQVEQDDFTSAANDGRDATATVAIAAGVLALLAAGGVLTGIGRRLAEYR
ncbi:hypothetical protein [Kitasatospora viridis]|uniref:Secreted protein n=1 Tax=Kitasatospora viridis TaxID=281105 RepID=A0A561UDQ5_9ACTN|nr:hypothetical protein [Kitasatospora viridis]TWF97491.1 hypothetical protein FHX73_111271 [Kitasatospora viridis]